MKKRGLSKITIILAVVVVLVIFLAVLLGIINYSNAPKQMLRGALNSVRNKTISVVESNKEKADALLNNKCNINGEANLTIALQEETKQMLDLFGIGKIIDIVNGYTYQINATTDFANKEAQANFGVKARNGESLKFETSYSDNKAYLNVVDVTDGYVELEEEISLDEMIKSLENKNLKSVVNKLFKILDTSLKDEYFTKTTETINLEGKEVKVIKSSLSMTTKQLAKFKESVFEKIKADEEIVEYIRKANNNETKEEVISELNESIAKLKPEERDNERVILELSVYKRSAFEKIIKYTFAIDEYAVRYLDEATKLKDVVTITKYKTENSDMLIEVDDSKITVKETAKDTYEIKVTGDDNSIITINGVISLDKVDLTYSIYVDATSSANGVIRLLSEDENIDYNITYLVKDGVNIKFNFKGTYDTNSNVAIEKVESSKQFETMQSDEVQEKLNKKYEAIEVNEIIRLIEKTLKTSTEDMHEDEDYTNVESLAMKVLQNIK